MLMHFQTAIVGIVGFAGVIVTLYTNARIARTVRRAAIEHDRETLKASLIEELKILRHSFVTNAEGLPQMEARGGEHAVTSAVDMTPVFDSQISKIGLLTKNQLEKSLSAYLQIKQLGTTLPLVGDRLAPDQQLFRIRPTHVGQAAATYANLAQLSTLALDALGV